MSDIIELIGSLFKEVFRWLDNFSLIGSFSLLDFLIACIVVDIVITALFVTFNVHVGGSDGGYVESSFHEGTNRRMFEQEQYRKNNVSVSNSSSPSSSKYQSNGKPIQRY